MGYGRFDRGGKRQRSSNAAGRHNVVPPAVEGSGGRQSSFDPFNRTYCRDSCLLCAASRRTDCFASRNCDVSRFSSSPRLSLFLAVSYRLWNSSHSKRATVRLVSALLAIFVLETISSSTTTRIAGARARSLVVHDRPERIHVLFASVRRRVQFAYHVRLNISQIARELPRRLVLRGQRFLNSKNKRLNVDVTKRTASATCV